MHERLTTFLHAITSRRALVVYAVIVATFFLGAFSSLYKIGLRSWVPAAIDKTKIVLGLVKPEGTKEGLTVSTERYEFDTAFKVSESGVFQLATTDGKNVLAVERNTGLLILLTPNGTTYQESTLSASVLPTAQQGKEPADPQPPVIMDLHYGLGRLLYSVVLQDNKKACQSIALFELPLTLADKKVGAPAEKFRTPCLADTKNAVMWGGRITNNKQKIFLSVGEQRYDRSGYRKKRIVSEEDFALARTVFGKVLAMDPTNYSYTVFTAGHRNAQGLFWDEDRRQLWSAEHGANGGDEVNLLIQGKNYGWPLVSYGKPYPERFPSGVQEIWRSRNPSRGVDTIPERKGYLSGAHTGYAEPTMVWSPGVGVGNLLRVTNASPLADWRGDLLVATMGEARLHRLRLNAQSAVIMDENIKIGLRIRDMIVLGNGHIALAFDQGSTVVLKVADL